ncbi:MAG: hypothetical protein H0X72_07130 [Acidobacteria bacterium]|nr:hypothetical protein [Acidobacteriota bacterium]
MKTNKIDLEIEREYEYKPSWLIILLCGGMFGLAAIFFAVRANSNDRGLIINRIVELSENGATTFYWVFCFLSLCFVAITIALTFHRLKFRQRIAFTAAGIIVPVSRWSADEKLIEYKNISALSESNVSGQTFLYLFHSGGKYVINRSMLPSKKLYREIIELLEQRIEHQ